MSLDDRATRWLARRAFDAGAISPIAWEFIDDEPTRAEEVLEFVRWIAGAPIRDEEEEDLLPISRGA